MASHLVKNKKMPVLVRSACDEAVGPIPDACQASKLLCIRLEALQPLPVMNGDGADR